MDLFVKDKYYNIDSKRDLDVCLKENGFNYRVHDAFLS